MGLLHGLWGLLINNISDRLLLNDMPILSLCRPKAHDADAAAETQTAKENWAAECKGANHKHSDQPSRESFHNGFQRIALFLTSAYIADAAVAALVAWDGVIGEALVC